VHLGIVLAELHVLVLQSALSGLIANRAIERVIDQMEIKAPTNRILHHIRRVVDDHSLFDFGVTGDLQLWHAFNLNHAQAANAGDTQSWMPTVMTDIDARGLERLNNGRTLRDFDVFAVDLDFRHGGLRETEWDATASVARTRRGIWSRTKS